MPYMANVIEVFLSSPGDVLVERETITALAAEWNQQRGRQTSSFISIKTWEHIVAPSVGERVQQVVSDQMGQDYDVYLGLMWTRLGTPTGLAASGTVEEFNQALARLRSGGRVWVANIFKKGAVSFDDIDPQQIAQVKEFKQRVASEGGFYREFTDENSLRLVTSLLFDQISRFFRSENPVPEQLTQFTLSSEVEISGGVSELGVLEVAEEFARIVADQVIDLQELADREIENTKIISEATEELSRLSRYGTARSDTVKPVVLKTADSMDRLALFFESKQVKFDKQAIDLGRLIEQELVLRLDFNDPMGGGYGDSIQALVDMKTSLQYAVDSSNELIKTIDSLPRLSTALARAKSRLSKVRAQFVFSLLNLISSIDNSLRAFEESAARVTIIDIEAKGDGEGDDANLDDYTRAAEAWAELDPAAVKSLEAMKAELGLAD